MIINDHQKPAIRLSDLLVFELIFYRVHINQSNAKRIHQKKYITKYTVQNITNLIHESRLKPSSLNIFQLLKRREGEGWFMALFFQDIPWPIVLG